MVVAKVALEIKINHFYADDAYTKKLFGFIMAPKISHTNAVPI
jgi:hypothetical protein